MDKGRARAPRRSRLTWCGQRRWGANTEPEFTAIEPGLHDVDENTPAGRDIGAPVTATDAESDPLTYSLDDRHTAIFDINRNTGQLRTKAALDYETRPSYSSVTVTATDTAGGNYFITIIIGVNNLDEPGTVMLSSPQPLVAIRLIARLDDLDGSQ